MANEEQLAILKQGVKVWNKWKEENPLVKIDLSGADLMGIDLVDVHHFDAPALSADLNHVNLTGANMRGADLRKASLNQATLTEIDLGDANLEQANLTNATLIKANLRRANLSAATFTSADLTGADLTQTNLSSAILSQANLTDTDLSLSILFYTVFSWTMLLRTKFSDALLGNTVFISSDLTYIVDLEKVNHRNPSNVGIETFAICRGKIPEVFLRGCGLRDWEIELAKLYNPSLSNQQVNNIQYKMYELRATQALQISPLFISYSHADSPFIDKLESNFNNKGVRFWRDIHDMKAGRIETQIDKAIRQNPTVLLVLSEHSLNSDWVEHEVRMARELEKDMKRDMLCPVALDDSWKSSHWPKRIMEQIMEYNILDFSVWKDDSKFEGIFQRLIDGLELFYEG